MRPEQSLLEPWFFVPEARAEARWRMYCFPYAGGGPMVFQRWATRLSRNVEFVGVRLPGREQRLSEPAFVDWLPLLQALVEVFVANPDRRPYWFFGHSLGASLAYELTWKLREAGLAGPQQLVLAGCRSPDVPLRARRMANLPLSELKACLRDMSGTPPEVLDSASLMAVLTPALRADIGLAEKWSEQLIRPPLDIPITVLAATDDPIASPTDSSGWQRKTTAAGAIQCFTGGHFFVRNAEEAVLKILDGLCGDHAQDQRDVKTLS